MPFLLLGLGVDDAFVLASEFAREFKAIRREFASRDTPPTPDEVQEGIRRATMLTIKSGGVSILVTSLTDGLAFLVGSTTVLPALSWFCTFTGLGVLFTFLFQICLFVPCLLINAQRAEARRYDLLCCFKSNKEHTFEKPQGGCCCFSCCPCTFETKHDEGGLERALGKVGELITTFRGRIAVLVTTAVFFSVGIVGVTRIEAEFQLEWFIPDTSYVRTYFDLNDEFFAAGVPFAVYTRDVDYFRKQKQLRSITEWLEDSPFIDRNEDVEDWNKAFRAYYKEAIPNKLDDDNLIEDEEDYYEELLDWIWDEGSEFQSSVLFEDDDCNDEDEYKDCDPNRCVLPLPLANRLARWVLKSPGVPRTRPVRCRRGVKAARMNAVTKQNFTSTGQDRVDTIYTMRRELNAILNGTFPYSTQYLFWEEVAYNAEELVKNLAICAAVILVVVFILIPKPRASIWVIIAVFLTVTDVVVRRGLGAGMASRERAAHAPWPPRALRTSGA